MEAIINEILSLVKKKMQEQGGYDREAYKQYIEETIQYFQTKGKISEDDNTEFIEDRLMDMWPQVQESISREY